jgi:putative hydrolase of the HAD superfamily
MTRITGVLFDSGGTLARPLAGGWWPKPRFSELVSAAGLPLPDEARLTDAYAAAARRLTGRLLTLDEELAAYSAFYTATLADLYGTYPGRLPDALAQAAVFDLDQEPYEDVVPTLDRLAAAGLRLGVVSNAAPSIELRHQGMGLRDYFDPFVVSAVVGHAKPAREIYEIALAAWRATASDVAFVDDVEENVVAAAALGMVGYLIDRDGVAVAASVPTITGLGELARLLGLEHAP